jgi:TPR repeat protein
MVLKKKFILVLGLLFTFAFHLFANDFEKGLDAYLGGKYQKAFQIWSTLAEDGHTKAQLFSGLMLMQGKGVRKDYVLSYMWIFLAGVANERGAREALSLITSKMTDEQMARAVHLSKEWESNRKYESGVLGNKFRVDSEKQYNRGLIKMNKREYTEARECFYRAAMQGDVEAQYYLGVLSESGLGVPQDYNEAIFWYQRAAKEGLDLAQIRLAMNYALGKGVSMDLVDAYKWSVLVASKSKATLQKEIGKELVKSLMEVMSSKDITKARKQALVWWKQYQQNDK